MKGKLVKVQANRGASGTLTDLFHHIRLIIAFLVVRGMLIRVVLPYALLRGTWKD